MARKIQQWLDEHVRPFRDKPISWIAQYHFFRDPICPTSSDLNYFAPADRILIYQRTVRADECIVEIKAYRDCRRLPFRPSRDWHLRAMFLRQASRYNPPAWWVACTGGATSTGRVPCPSTRCRTPFATADEGMIRPAGSDTSHLKKALRGQYVRGPMRMEAP